MSGGGRTSEKVSSHGTRRHGKAAAKSQEQNVCLRKTGRVMVCVCAKQVEYFSHERMVD